MTTTTVRPVSESGSQSIMLDSWPRPAAVCDFGVNSQRHYEALYYPIRSGELTAEALDKALGNGPALTKLVAECPSNPHKDIQFCTAWDALGVL